MSDNGRLTPVWSEGPILPLSLTDHVLALNETVDEESEFDELELSSDEEDDEHN